MHIALSAPLMTMPTIVQTQSCGLPSAMCAGVTSMQMGNGYLMQEILVRCLALFIEASLSDPHTSDTALCTCVYVCICLFACGHIP